MSNVVAKYQKYAEYKDSGTDWLGEIPTHWDVQPTKRFFRLIAEPAPENNDYELLSVYTEIGVKPRKELEQKGNKASTTDGYWLVKKGDIVVNKLLAWMGAVGYSEYDGVTSPAYDILRPTKKLNPKFYHYLFRTKIANMEFKRWSRGIMEMRLRLYFDELGRIAMPFPTFKEQNEIVNFLDHETAKIDHLIEKQQQLIELLKEKRQAVISHAVTKGLNPDVPMKDSGVEWLGEVPEHWEGKPLKYLCTYNDDTLSETTPKETEIQYIDIGSVSAVNGISKIETMIFKDAPSRARRIVRDGDVIVSTVRTYLEAIASIDNPPENLVVSTGFIVIRPNQYLYKGFASYCLRAKGFIKEVIARSVGVSYPAINSSDLVNISIPSLEYCEQMKITNFLDSQTAKIDELIRKAESAIELMQERRTALISAAVTGKIDVRHHASRPTGNDNYQTEVI